MKKDLFTKEYIKNKLQKETFSVDIEGQTIIIDIDTFFDFLNLPEEEYEEFFNVSKNSEIDGIDKRHFLYALIIFFVDNFKRKNISEEHLKRLEDIMSMQKLDIESLNKLNDIQNPHLDKFVLNEELKKHILENLPTDLTDIEKCIYIYIKMCKSLTYDETFFIFDQQGPAAQKHAKISYLSQVNPQNNKIVCYEFNALFSKLLEEIGIKTFEILSDTNDYHEHAYLYIKCGKFLLTADAVTSILYSDLTNAKLNKPLNGLLCENENDKTAEEFEEIQRRIYQLIIDEEKNENVSNIAEYEETFDDIVSEYRKVTKSEIDIPIEDRLRILLEKVKTANVPHMDTIAYIKQLEKILFSKYERARNIDIRIIRAHENEEAGPITIITTNDKDLQEYKENNKYYMYIYGEEIKEVTNDEIEESFKNGVFKYLRSNKKSIPGITLMKGQKR